MRTIAFISALILLSNNFSFANGSLQNDFPVSLSKYTFNNDDIQSGRLTDLIVAGKQKSTIFLSKNNPEWLFLKGNSICIKKNSSKKALNKKEIKITVGIKQNNKIIEKSFTLLADHFHKNKVIAHRGAWKNSGSPENSLASLKAAISLGCFGSETDVHMTNDSALVINHDPVWAGFPIQKTNLIELQQTKLSNGESLPLLSDFLKTIKTQTATKLILEIKPSERGREWANATARKVIKTVEEAQAQAWLVYISFDYEILKEILRLEPSANVQYLNGDKAPGQLKIDGIKGADYHFSVFQKHPEWIKSAKENKIDLNSWTVNNGREMQWLLANDFSFITTNEPELLFKEVEKSPVSKGWKLVWSDEFNNAGLPDSSKWNYDIGGSGWGNNEKQFYAKGDTANTIVKNGILSIIARKEKHGNNDYSSARLLTRGKAEWTYGRIEINAKLPPGVGLWPAAWMLGKNIDKVGWPDGGEIDIMEHVGFRKDTVFGTVHTGAYNHVKGTQKGKDAAIENAYTQFHTFAIEWAPDKIDFLLDDKIYNHFANEHKTLQEWPFDQPFYLLLNMAVGGNLGGKMGIDDAVFPAVYQIDYVRVYQ